MKAEGRADNQMCLVPEFDGLGRGKICPGLRPGYGRVALVLRVLDRWAERVEDLEGHFFQPLEKV